MVFNKIDAYKHLTIDEDDLMTEKLRHYTLKSGSYLDGSWAKMHFYFGNKWEFWRI
jgi:hypothetical protein